MTFHDAITNAQEYVGLSSETKPTAGVAKGSTFWEFDTRTGYIFDGISTWYVV